jgi:hypothetical protein
MQKKYSAKNSKNALEAVDLCSAIKEQAADINQSREKWKELRGE